MTKFHHLSFLNVKCIHCMILYHEKGLQKAAQMVLWTTVEEKLKLFFFPYASFSCVGASASLCILEWCLSGDRSCWYNHYKSEWNVLQSTYMCLMGDVKGALSFPMLFQREHFHTHETCQGRPNQVWKIISRKMEAFTVTTKWHQTEKNRITHKIHTKIKETDVWVYLAINLLYNSVPGSTCLL